MSLVLELDRDGGELVRFGPDSPDRPTAISFTTSAAGGYGNATVSVPRPEWKNDESLLFCAARLYEEGGKTRYEGRVADISQDGEHAVRLDLEGWAAHLDDNKFFRALYVDRDLAKIVGTDASLRAVYIFFAVAPTDGGVSFSADDGQPTITLAAMGNTSAVQQVVGVAYDTKGLGIGSVYYEFARGTNVTSSWTARITTEDLLVGAASSTVSANLALSASSTGTHTAGDATQVFVTFELLSPAADGGTEGLQHDVTFKRVAFFGNHGLTVRGTAPEQGYFPGDIIEHAVQASSPLLNIGQIDKGAPVVGQAAYLEPTTGRAVVEDIGGLGTPAAEVPEWGVYDGREFFWRTPGTGGRRWRVRRDQLAIPVDDGPSAQNRFAEMVVKFQTGGGETYYVGPPGSGADYEDDRLVSSPLVNNPAAKVPRRRDVIDAGVTFLEGATLLGQAELADRNANIRRGSATIGGTVTDEAGVVEPAAALRAGDTLLVEDEGGTPLEQYVNGTSYADDSATVTASLGTEPLKVELILARLRNAAGF